MLMLILFETWMNHEADIFPTFIRGLSITSDRYIISSWSSQLADLYFLIVYI